MIKNSTLQPITKNNFMQIKQDNTQNKPMYFGVAVLPVIILISLLFLNISFANRTLFGNYSNQIILLIGAFTASIIGVLHQYKTTQITQSVWHNIKSVKTPISILLLVGALAGSWLISGVIPAMVFYGLQILNPKIFLPATVIVTAIVSLSTGSSWTTTATVGIALIGIGTALGIEQGIIAGAVISGAYFGDKISPLSDTTNLAPAMAGTNLFTHIKYMLLTTFPTFVITLLFFLILSVNIKTSGQANIEELLIIIQNHFYITPWLFLIPVSVIVLIILKTKPLVALSLGILFALIFALIFQLKLVNTLYPSKLETLLRAIISNISIKTTNNQLNNLFSTSGVIGMLSTIALIICAMIFGGVMDAIGALNKITTLLLKLSNSIFGLFASTVATCLGLNIITADQYLAIVIPGKMFKEAYQDKNLAPENLSRTLEDSGTVTSVLIPWNTCGAYQASVLGVNVSDYFIYAIFNWLSPFTTLFFAALSIKIKQLNNK